MSTNPRPEEIFPPLPFVIEDNLLSLKYGDLTLLVPESLAFLYYSTYIIGQYDALQVRPGDVVLDAGANVGDFTISAARQVGSLGIVIAVEPNPVLLRILERNVRLNRLQNVKIVPKALAGSKGSAWLEDDHIGGSIESVPRYHSIRVDTVTLVDAVKSAGAGLPSVVKMDIEGKEGEVLSDETSLSGVRDLVVELHGAGNRTSVIESLTRRGYEIHEYGMSEVVARTLKNVLRHFPDVARTELLTRMIAMRSIADFARTGRRAIPSVDPSRELLMIHAVKT